MATFQELPSGNFPNDQFPKPQLPKSVLAAALGPQPVLIAALGPLAHPSRSARPPLQPAAPQSALPNLWKVADWEGNCTFVKLPVGKLSLGIGSRPWESTLHPLITLFFQR